MPVRVPVGDLPDDLESAIGVELRCLILHRVGVKVLTAHFTCTQLGVEQQARSHASAAIRRVDRHDRDSQPGQHMLGYQSAYKLIVIACQEDQRLSEISVMGEAFHERLVGAPVKFPKPSVDLVDVRRIAC